MSSTRIKWRDRTPENDIHYGGFLSYRHLRIIAWLCLAIAQVAVILQLEVKLAPDTQAVVEKWTTVINIIGGLPVPLFMLANMSVVLQKRGNYRALFKTYGMLALVMYLLANFVVFHYGFRTIHAFNEKLNWGDAARLFGELLPALGKTGYVLNIFIDMLLIVFMFFFANYEPTKYFQGKKIYLFRAMFLLPVAYEVASIIIKYNIGMGNFTIPSPVFFLLPSKPPFIFAALVVIVLVLKIGEFSYTRRSGNTKEMYEEHIKTRAHSLKISISIAIVFAIFAVVDFLVCIGLIAVSFSHNAQQYAQYGEEFVETMVLADTTVYENIGFGGAIGLLFITPLVLLFSYSKQHKNPKLDLFVTIGGVGLVAIVLLEGCFQVITLNIPSFIDKIKKVLEGDPEGEQARMQVNYLLSCINSIRL